MQTLTLSLPGSGINNVVILGGRGNGVVRIPRGTYTISGFTAGNIPRVTNTNKRFEWQVQSKVTAADIVRIESMIYAQEENNALGNILIDDMTEPIPPSWLNWGSRTAIGSAITVDGVARRFFRTYGIVTINGEFQDRFGVGADGNQWYEVQLLITEVI